MVSPTNPILYDAPRKCIYCGDDSAPRSTEHIIPFALDGSWAIPAASCPNCAKRTASFENACLHDMRMFKPARVRFKTATRRARPKKLPVYEIDSSGRLSERHVSPEKHHATLLIVAPPPPKLLEHLYAPKDAHVSVMWLVGSEDGLEIPDDGKLLLSQFDQLAFVRMIAKIAHCWTVARLGLEGFEPYLTALIRKESPEFGEWIGREPLTPPPTTERHRMGLNRLTLDCGACAVVAVQLFAKFGAPVMLAVTGRIKT